MEDLWIQVTGDSVANTINTRVYGRSMDPSNRGFGGNHHQYSSLWKFSLARRTKLRKFGRARRSSRRPKVTILIWKDRYLSHASRRSGMKPFGSTMRPRLIFYRDMSGKRVNEAHGGFGVSNGPSSSAKGLDRIEKRPG
ncbi:unnamed protein product [Microthlaspi erraticum]|uniref:Uncharacterized protein n=1 Tax=Microthlaspi erraticum TaxID=1685480 RepID=A0A6D2J3F1_9BRAS|nr:unnamed protein product [Microthlaspi erraticum]